MQGRLFLTSLFLSFAIIIGLIVWNRENKDVTPGMVDSVVVTPSTAQEVLPTMTPSPASYTIPQGRFVSQSFNNCGPASLSMLMSMYGKHVDQEVLADRMRPFHNPAGGVDDKSIFAEEFVTYAKEYGFEALERPNGDIEMLKQLVARDIPVVVRTWLHPGEDIGHFRIVRGYNDATQTIIQDDSYEGPNLSYSYTDFLTMWQPFNYGYILIYPKEKDAIVREILGENMNSKTAYERSIVRADRELQENPDAFYPSFNKATAYFYLGKYEEARANYEQVSSELPARMLWYQIEPIQTYQKLQADDEVFTLTDRILNNGNKAYSELYQMRGEIYQRQGRMDEARQEFENASYYNDQFKPAQESLRALNG